VSRETASLRYTYLRQVRRTRSGAGVRDIRPAPDEARVRPPQASGRARPLRTAYSFYRNIAHDQSTISVEKNSRRMCGRRAASRLQSFSVDMIGEGAMVAAVYLRLPFRGRPACFPAPKRRYHFRTAFFAPAIAPAVLSGGADLEPPDKAPSPDVTSSCAHVRGRRGGGLSRNPP
jgi:hypothetical protein